MLKGKLKLYFRYNEDRLHILATASRLCSLLIAVAVDSNVPLKFLPYCRKFSNLSLFPTHSFQNALVAGDFAVFLSGSVSDVKVTKCDL